MDYTEVQITCDAETADILSSLLAELDFDSFDTRGDQLLAYVPAHLYKEGEVQSLLAEFGVNHFEAVHIPAQNWNAAWEAGFEPVVINEKCRIRAPHHAPGNYPFELVIQPKMSFGTGHHATTAMIADEMFRQDWKGLSVLDFGCGTGVLAILASKLGANPVVGVDIEPWAVENTMENAALNHVENITAICNQTVAPLPQEHYHVILANINKNTILAQLPFLASSLHKGGVLYTSGYFVTDLEDLVTAAAGYGFGLKSQRQNNEWCMAVFYLNL